MLKKEKIRKQRKIFRVRKSIIGSSERPRLTVFRSLNHIYAQLIDDSKKITLVSASTRSGEIVDDLKKAKTKTDKAQIVGALLAKKALEKDIKLTLDGIFRKFMTFRNAIQIGVHKIINNCIA